jgi:hypothetical protein
LAQLGFNWGSTAGTHGEAGILFLLLSSTYGAGWAKRAGLAWVYDLHYLKSREELWRRKRTWNDKIN